MRRDQRLKRVDLITSLLTVFSFFIILGMGFYLKVFDPRSNPGNLWYLIITTILMLLTLVKWHSYNYIYICGQCQYKFKLSFFQDLVSPQWPPDKKYVKCPNCKTRSWMREHFS